MKKLVGVGLILFVAANSALLPLWLSSADTQTNEVPVVAARFQPAVPPPAALAPGQPVAARQTGRVHEVYFREGQRVRQGQVLLKVVERLLSVPQQQLTARLQRQELAHTALLHQLPAASAAELTAAQQQLTATRQVLARQVPMLSFVFVTAPADGIITEQLAHPGDPLTPATPVATLAPLPVSAPPLLLTSTE